MALVGVGGLFFSVDAATTTPATTTLATSTLSTSTPTTATTTPAAPEPKPAVVNSGNNLVGGLIFEKDLIALLCLDSQWQGGEFLAGVGAYSDLIASSSKEFPDLKSKLADLAAYQKTGQEKIAAVCASVSYEQAKSAMADLDSFEKTTQAVLREIDVVITKTFQDKIDGLKNKISDEQKNQIRAAVTQLKISKQAELTSLANQLTQAAQNFLTAELSRAQLPTPSQATGYANRITNDRQTEIKNQLANMALQAQSLLRQEAQTKTLQVLGGDSANIALLVKGARENREAIVALQQKRVGQLDKIKAQALQKRKELAALILSNQVDNGVNRLREKESLKESLSSPLFLNTQQAVDYLSGIKKNFNQKAQAALTSNDENALDAAIKEGEASYRVVQLALPGILLNENNPQEFCSSTPILKSQMQGQIDRLFLLLQKAAKPFSNKARNCQKNPEKSGCAIFNQAFGELSAIQQNAQRINDVFANAPAYCQAPTNGAMPTGSAVSLSSLKAFSLRLKQQLIDWQTNWPRYQNSF